MRMIPTEPMAKELRTSNVRKKSEKRYLGYQTKVKYKEVVTWERQRIEMQNGGCKHSVKVQRCKVNEHENANSIMDAERQT